MSERPNDPKPSSPERRGFLKIGSLGLGGLSLARLLRAQAHGGRAPDDRAVIMVYLPGGPTQHETFDPKPHAPVEIRGSFGPISTAVAGVQFCETLPKLARMADKFSIVRTVVGMRDRHGLPSCMTRVRWKPCGRCSRRV